MSLNMATGKSKAYMSEIDTVYRTYLSLRALVHVPLQSLHYYIMIEQNTADRYLSPLDSVSSLRFNPFLLFFSNFTGNNRDLFHA